MTDYTGLYFELGVLIAVFGVILYRMCLLARPGQVGLIFILGKYRTCVGPGFALVSVIATVRKVPVGGGANHVLGMLGTDDSDIPGQDARGVVTVGDTRLAATATTVIRLGATIRVIDDTQLGEVVVATEHPRSGGPAAAQPSSR